MDNIQVTSNSTVCFCNTANISDYIEKTNKTVIFACKKSENYAMRLAEILSKKGYDVYTYITGDGEDNKTIEKAMLLTQFLSLNFISRSDLLINIGGGTVCDLGAFVASVYMRGIKYYNVPTTLLCAVDACIGGKTAINANGGKNLWGTFYQPSKVLIDSLLISNLPENVFNEGLSEIVKYAILNEEFNAYLQKLNGTVDLRLNLQTILNYCLSIKAKFVQIDEFDKNERKLLNLGHTVAHSIEAVSSYTLNHSISVGLGIKYETEIAFKMGLISENRHNQISLLINKFLTLEECQLNSKHIFFMARDKKNIKNGKIVFALPNETSASVYEIDCLELENILLNK